jgi:hypothetical protein
VKAQQEQKSYLCKVENIYSNCAKNIQNVHQRKPNTGAGMINYYSDTNNVASGNAQFNYVMSKPTISSS